MRSVLRTLLHSCSTITKAVLVPALAVHLAQAAHPALAAHPAPALRPAQLVLSVPPAQALQVMWQAPVHHHRLHQGMAAALLPAQAAARLHLQAHPAVHHLAPAARPVATLCRVRNCLTLLRRIALDVIPITEMALLEIEPCSVGSGSLMSTSSLSQPRVTTPMMSLVWRNILPIPCRKLLRDHVKMIALRI